VIAELVETPRIRLERWGAPHRDALVAINREPEVVQYINAGVPLTDAQSLAQSARIAAHWERYGFGLWAVVERESGRTLGFAGLSHPLWFPHEAERVEVGWRLHPDAWGRGFATEASTAAVVIGFTDLGLDALVSYIHVANARSRAVSRRLGMELERTIAHPTQPHGLDVFALARPTEAGPSD
jgi:3-dehydroquinate dehydratase/shikimate dehydrogenase